MDYAGNNLSKTAAAKMKAVNKRKGWPDIEIYDASFPFYGLSFDLKKEKERLIMENDSDVFQIMYYANRTIGGVKKKIPIREGRKRKAGEWKDIHTEVQANVQALLTDRNRASGFGVGIVNCLKIVEGYMNQDWTLMCEGFQYHTLPYANSIQFTKNKLLHGQNKTATTTKHTTGDII